MTCFWAPLGWLTYHLVDIGDGWWAAFPAVPAAVFPVATLGLLGETETVAPDDEPKAEDVESQLRAA